MEKTLKKIGSNQKGITLIALIVTIIILLVLASTIVFQGIETYKKAKVEKFIAEMQAIQDKVDLIVTNNEEYITLGQDLEAQTNAQNALANAFKNGEIKNQYVSEDNQYYRYFSITDISNYFEIDNAMGDIIVNFKTREVVSTNGIEDDEKIYYTQYNLPGGQKVIENIEIDDREIADIKIIPNIDGLNATIQISNIGITNGKITYKIKDGIWNTITNYTQQNKTYEVLISISGTYIFRLADNNNLTNFKEATLKLELTNMPDLEEGMKLTEESYNYSNYETDSSTWAYAEKNGVRYVWVPRFAYDADNNIKFLRGNSTIATDNSYIDSNWGIPTCFEKNNQSLTGVWREATSTENFRLIDLIDN